MHIFKVMQCLHSIHTSMLWYSYCYWFIRLALCISCS